MNGKQKIRTILIPEAGLELQPPHVVESEIETNFTRAMAHIVGMGPRGPVLLACTSDGRIKTAAAGTGLEIYEVEPGTAADAWNAGDTFEYADAYSITDIFIETHPAIIAFRNAAFLWGDEKVAPVGFMSLELTHYGMRIRNRGAGNNAVYEFTIYR